MICTLYGWQFVMMWAIHLCLWLLHLRWNQYTNENWLLYFSIQICYFASIQIQSKYYAKYHVATVLKFLTCVTFFSMALLSPLYYPYYPLEMSHFIILFSTSSALKFICISVLGLGITNPRQISLFFVISSSPCFSVVSRCS